MAIVDSSPPHSDYVPHSFIARRAQSTLPSSTFVKCESDHTIRWYCCCMRNTKVSGNATAAVAPVPISRGCVLRLTVCLAFNFDRRGIDHRGLLSAAPGGTECGVHREPRQQPSPCPGPAPVHPRCRRRARRARRGCCGAQGFRGAP